MEPPSARSYQEWNIASTGISNNRTENFHQPTRQRERRMQRFKSTGHAQRFLSAYGPIVQHFRPRRHRFFAPDYRQEMQKRFQSSQEVTSPALAA
jgi:putative transposase